jgi:acetoin utilization protein AcuB
MENVVQLDPTAGAPDAADVSSAAHTAGAWAVATFPTITPDTTVATALRLVREHGLPALPVCAGRRFVGLVRKEDLLRLTPSEATLLDVHEQRELLARVTVHGVVEPAPVSATPDAPILDVARRMAASGASVVPVVDERGLVGLLPWTAALAAAAHIRREG